MTVIFEVRGQVSLVFSTMPPHQEDAYQVGERRILLGIECDQRVVEHVPTMADVREEKYGREC